MDNTTHDNTPGSDIAAISSITMDNEFIHNRSQASHDGIEADDVAAGGLSQSLGLDNTHTVDDEYQSQKDTNEHIDGSNDDFIDELNGYTEESLFLQDDMTFWEDEKPTSHQEEEGGFEDYNDGGGSINQLHDGDQVNHLDEPDLMSLQLELDRKAQDSPPDCVSEQAESGELSGNPSSSQTSENTIKKPRAKAARNAREFWTRKFQLEAEKKQLGEKRGSNADASGSRKRRKIAKRDHQWPDYKSTRSNSDRSNSLHGIGNIEKAIAGGAIPSMGTIRATTHASQFSQIKENIAKGLDTRRSRTQERDLKEAVKSFGLNHVKADNGRWRLSSMKTSLMNHQMTVASWMTKRECSGTEPFGGLVADEMGLGKTIMSLACITENPPQQEDIKEYCRATLIVVPSRIIAKQWQEEIRNHCMPEFSERTMIYTSAGGQTAEAYRASYFVITSYFEVMSQYPAKADISSLKEKNSGDSGTFQRDLQGKLGELFNINWYRVILDEAHQIKNVTGRTSLACCSLSAKYRWALSGTPLSNTPEEYFPYLKFIGCQFTTTRKDFRLRYVDGINAAAHFDALASLTMYRRTQKDSFLNCVIVDLLNHTTEDVWVSLSTEETLIFETVKEHYNQLLQKFKRIKQKQALTPREQEIETSIKHAMGVRLRQAVCHPFTLETLFRNSFKLNAISVLRDQLKSTKDKKSIIKQLEASFKNNTSNMGSYTPDFSRLKAFPHSSFGGYFDLYKLLHLCQYDAHVRGKTCAFCNKTPPIAFTSSTCEHIYCQKCAAASFKTTSKCPGEDCQESFHPMDAGGIPDIQFNAKHDKCYREPAADSNNVRIVRQPECNGFFTASAYKKGITIPPSAKLTMAMAFILDWQAKFPDDKIIVFTQWVISGKILGSMLEKAGIGFLYFYGTLNQRQRDKAIKAFKEEADKKILVAGLKCGGQALNLTVANRIIVVDPWWNSTVEQQASGRVHRIGQKKKTHLVRIMSDTPIDRRISELQCSKSARIDYALQDDGHVPIELSDEALEKLFAPPAKKEREKIQPSKY